MSGSLWILVSLVINYSKYKHYKPLTMQPTAGQQSKSLSHRPYGTWKILKKVHLGDLYPHKVDILWRSEQLKTKDLAGPFLRNCILKFFTM